MSPIVAARRKATWKLAFGDYAASLAIAILAMGVALQPATRLLDELFFDSVTRMAPGYPPSVVLVEQDAAFRKSGLAGGQALVAAVTALGAERLCFRAGSLPHAATLASSVPTVVGQPVEQVPSSHLWRLTETAADLPRGATAAASRLGAPHYGVHRSQNYGLPASKGVLPLLETACAGRSAILASYLIPMADAQNIPSVTASQIVSGTFRAGELRGMIVLLADPDPANQRWLVTPRDPEASTTPSSLLRAYAIQALANRAEVHTAPSWLVVAAVLLATLLATVMQRRSPRKRLALPLIGAGALTLTLACAAILIFGKVLMPLTAMIAGFITAALVQVLREEHAQDQRLAQTLEQAINLSFSRSVSYDQARIPDYLNDLARLLKMPRMVVLERGEVRRWRTIAEQGDGAENVSPDQPAVRRLLVEAERAQGAIPAASVASGWSDQAQIAFLSEGDSDYAWLYDPPGSRLGPHVLRVAHAVSRNLRQMRQWQYRLLGGGRDKAALASIDARVASAARLITVQSEQIREGLDALDTAVLIFHPAGFAIQANQRMRGLLDQLDLLLERTTLGEAIVAMTGLSIGQSDTIVQRILLRGGEMRVPMPDIASRQYILRIGASREQEEGWQRVIVLEAVDISELDQLAELRLAVGLFIDRQLRNDLEAIALGATLALDPRLEPSALARVVERIKDVTARATGRLEQVSELLVEPANGAATPCYPIEARKCIGQALERVESFAADLSVSIDATLPAISGFTMAEPLMLADMVEAILRLIIADTAQGGVVTLELQEGEQHTQVAISGGFGMPFDRLCEALDARPGEVPAEYQIAAAGFAEAIAWQGSVSYWSAAGDGYRFNIRLRRIG